MSTGAVINPAGGGAMGLGMATPTSQGTRPLTSEAVFRIEVSLSSRRSSAIVMKTTARLYSLEGAVPSVPGASPGKDAEWKPVAYGAPCIQLMRESTQLSSPFHLKLVIAEVESGIALWEQEVNKSCQYSAMQNNFHTFSVGGKTYAIQFANDSEAERMLESVLDLFEQKEKAETVSFDKKPTEPIFKKPKSIRKLNKKDISTPCNFKHVSGITLQRTQTCEEELRGTIQRKSRSMSLSSLSRRKARQELAQGGKKTAPSSGGVVVSVVKDTDQDQFKGLDISPMIARKAAGRDGTKSGRSNSILNKFGSLKLSKKKPHAQSSLKDEGGQPDSTVDGAFMRDKNRMSLPSHYRQRDRPTLTSDLFNGPDQATNQMGQSGKVLSRSSENLADPTHNTATSPTRKAATLDRRHTFVGPTSPRRKSPASTGGAPQFNYTPYSKSPQHHAQQPHPQQLPYGQGMPNGGAPYYQGKSATLGTHSAQHFHQQMKGYSAMQGGGGGMGVANGTNLSGSGGRLHVSDMGLHRTGVTGQAGYQVPAQNPAGYGPPRRRVSMNEMQVLAQMDGRPLQRNQMSSSGGIPVQQVQPVHPQGPVQYPQGKPHPQMVAPPTVPTSAPPTSAMMAITPTYPPTATAAQGGYAVPPGVMSAPRQQTYPVQSGWNGQYYGGQPQGNFPVAPGSGQTSLPTSGGRVVMVNGSPPRSHGTMQTSPSGKGMGGAVGGASVLSKPAASPMRQGSLSHSGGGGHRPREIVPTTIATSSYYDPSLQGQPIGGQQMQNPASHYQTPRVQSTAAPQMMAPPPTKFTNVQLHQRYHQQYLQLQKQGNKTTPYQPQATSSRPSMQRYHQEYERQQHMQKQQPPPVAKKSPPKNRLSPAHSHGQTHVPATHMNGSSNHAYDYTHRQMHSQQYQPEVQPIPPPQQEPHYQQPNNAYASASSPQRPGRALPNMQINNTSSSNGGYGYELAPRPNQSTPKFQPQSAQAYDTLPSGNDSFADVSTLDVDESLASVTDELDRFTEEMSKALEQFDSLLQPQTNM